MRHPIHHYPFTIDYSPLETPTPAYLNYVTGFGMTPSTSSYLCAMMSCVRKKRQPCSKALLIALFLGTQALACTVVEQPQHYDWPVYKADNASSSYSPLDQINRDNVARLELAWEYKTGDEHPYTIECNPLIIEGVMYVTSPHLNALALDAATGERLWTFTPSEAGPTRRDGARVNRGVTYWEEGDDKRILYVAGTWLFALDAETGQPLPDFGEGGWVDLTKGLDRDLPMDLPVSATSPGIIFEDLLILGSSIYDGTGVSPPGHIRAYDVRTGARAWIFHTIPQENTRSPMIPSANWTRLNHRVSRTRSGEKGTGEPVVEQAADWWPRNPTRAVLLGYTEIGPYTPPLKSGTFLGPSNKILVKYPIGYCNVF